MQSVSAPIGTHRLSRFTGVFHQRLVGYGVVLDKAHGQIARLPVAGRKASRSAGVTLGDVREHRAEGERMMISSKPN